jgi:1-acyl-sn-glycerol-3-phosphate acyltransferase
MFNRNDAYKMSKLKMCLSAYSLFPIRVLICILGVIIGIIGYSLISVMKRGWFRLKCLKVVAYLSSRLLMLSAGYIFISEEKRKPNEFLKDYKEERELGEEEVAIMIGNHVNFTDVFYMTMKYGCTFSARKDYKTIFPFNIVGKAYDAIWIDRLNDSQKKEALKEIKERVNDYLMKPCDK